MDSSDRTGAMRVTEDVSAGRERALGKGGLQDFRGCDLVEGEIIG
jgi:hypothetical protein